jgi:outer membrane immunogenic protein
MKTILSATALALIGTISAQAADMALKAPPLPAEAGWTGGYLGLNGGYGWGQADVQALPGDPNSQNVFHGLANIPPLAASIDTRGWLGGVQAGYDWQIASRWVAGFEADFDGAGIKGDAASPATIIFGFQPATFSTSQKIDWFGTARARLGYLATPDLLLYATGGLAYGKVNESATLSLAPGQVNSSGNFGFGFGCGSFLGPNCFAGGGSRVSAGWSAGVGGEQRITRNWSVKLEYLHVDLGRGHGTMLGNLPTGVPFLASFLNTSSSATFDLVRAGVNYRF